MKVFVSWSGERSRIVAEGLRRTLRFIDNAIEPFMSKIDIGAGSRWISDLNQQLEKTKVGVICLTCENLEAPWILFEAGSVSKSVRETCVLPYLLDVECTLLPPPLQQFQSVRADKDGTRKLVVAIHDSLGEESRLSREEILLGFETQWSSMEQTIDQARAGWGKAVTDRRKLLSLLASPRREPCHTQAPAPRPQQTEDGYSVTVHYNDEHDPLVSYINAGQEPGQISVWHMLQAKADERPFEARYFILKGSADFDVLADLKSGRHHRYSLIPGDSLLIPDSMWCSFRTTSKEPLGMLVVCIPRWKSECYHTSQSMPG